MKTKNIIFKYTFIVFTFVMIINACQQKGCENFNEFLTKFNIDKEFQKNRVIFPFVSEYYDMESDEFQIDNINEADWSHQDFSWDESYANRSTDAYKQEINTKNDTTIIQSSGINNGINCKATFVCKDGKWYYYKATDNSM